MLRLLTNANLLFLSKLLGYGADAQPSVLGVLTDLTGSQFFFNSLSICSRPIRSL